MFVKEDKKEKLALSGVDPPNPPIEEKNQTTTSSFFQCNTHKPQGHWNQELHKRL